MQSAFSNFQVILTEDGSHTLVNTSLQEQYHSKHGAIQESKHVFIKMGFEEIVTKKAHLKILEVGFGTGLNAYLTALENKKHQKSIFYTAVEAFPISMEDAAKLNYAELLTNKKQDDLFETLHRSPWEIDYDILPNFTLKKNHSTIQKVELSESFDLIYFDAFSPASQPEMWSEKIFEKLFTCLEIDGILVTYCAKGEVKRMLKKVGFEVVGLPGPPGKREMTAAHKLFPQ